MKLSDLHLLLQQDPRVKLLLQHLHSESSTTASLRQVKGSLDALLMSTMQLLWKKSTLVVVQDREEALYLQSDLKNFSPQSEVYIFPSSYKKPYQFDSIDNANVLQRAEVLNRLNQKNEEGELVISYPEALTEKVLSKKNLVENTMTAKVGEKLDLNFITELLHSYEFECTEFVYEPGQYAVRGGIIDIYSFSSELPYRIELWGDEIESIRIFDPNTQLSVENKKVISIIPNVQKQMVLESTESFLSFFPKQSLLWFKNVSDLKETLDAYFSKATEQFKEHIALGAQGNLLGKPEDRFQSFDGFKEDCKIHKIIEFGPKSWFKKPLEIDFESVAQTSILKEFKNLVEVFNTYQAKGMVCLIASDSPAQFDKIQTVVEEIDSKLNIQHLHLGLREGFVEPVLGIACYTDHQLFDRFYRFKSKEKHSKSKSLTLKELKTLQPGDYITHIDYGVAKFVGMEKVDINGKQQEAIRLLFRDDDMMKISIHALHKISKYSGKEGGPPQMSKLGSPDWDNKKKAVKKKLKDIAIDLIKLYAKRKAAPGYAFSADNFMQAELETSFLYEDTPDQAKATEDVKNDMQKPHPMDRLVCGDVGFGKTEIAVRAAFKAACDSKQVAILVPTTILAMQHYKTFKERLSKFPVRVEYISRFRTTAQIKETLQRVAEGKTDIVIGTHRLVSKDVKFKNLGLMIIDEEQKFGVAVKEKLKEFKVNVDTLTLTATPIPRTLHFSLMGARDLSIIATPPPNRQPVTTEVHTYSETILRDAIDYEIKRGGQVFVVHNRVADIESIADQIKRLVPDSRVAHAHGQMDGEKLEKVMLKFIEGEFDVLVSTNIIESGLDIPNANTMIIQQAHHFGLSDLHQMRGRVGRSNKKAFCYLMIPPANTLSSDARKRLHTLEEFSELGDGFKVAMRDLDIRGAGNLLGGEQSGFITDLGFDMYHRLLDEAIQELKESEFKDLFTTDVPLRPDIVPDCIIETDLSILIPETYVGNISERLGLYTELDSINNQTKLEEFVKGIQDRFGPLPSEVEDLIETVKLRWVAEKLGFEKLVLKNSMLKCYFSATQAQKYYDSTIFGNILQYVQTYPKRCLLKEMKDKLILQIDQVQTIFQAESLLKEILKEEKVLI